MSIYSVINRGTDAICKKYIKFYFLSIPVCLPPYLHLIDYQKMNSKLFFAQLLVFIALAVMVYSRPLEAPMPVSIINYLLCYMYEADYVFTFLIGTLPTQSIT